MARAALGLVVISAIGLVIMRDITTPSGSVLAVANQIAAGDLAVRVPLHVAQG